MNREFCLFSRNFRELLSFYWKMSRDHSRDKGRERERRKSCPCSKIEEKIRPVLDELLSPFLVDLNQISTAFSDINKDTAVALREVNRTMR